MSAPHKRAQQYPTRSHVLFGVLSAVTLGACAVSGSGTTPRESLSPVPDESSDPPDTALRTVLPPDEALCTEKQKICGNRCVSKVDPRFGCGDESCAPCSFARGIAACVEGKCVLGRCDMGRANCNGVNADGCEVDLRSDPNACGSCEHACAKPSHGSATCNESTCGVQCNIGFAACGSDCCPAQGRIALGLTHTCALTEAGNVRCWGDNKAGQLGVPNVEHSPFPLNVTLPSVARDVATGDGFSCALLESGSVYCWGRNDEGQAGHPGATASTPAEVKLGVGATRMGVGERHACALLVDGRVACWGSGTLGQMGDKSLASGYLPRVPALPSDVKEIAVGGNHSCAIRIKGELLCWGDNTWRQISKENADVFDTPAVVLPQVHMAALGQAHSCAIVGSQVLCWGSKERGQLGAPSSVPGVPVAVPLHNTPLFVGAGANNTCVVTEGGRVWCWGSNHMGQLGGGSADEVQGPSLVRQDVAGVAVRVGAEHACLLGSSGAARCWGNNAHGELGTGTDIARSLSPLPVFGLP